MYWRESMEKRSWIAGSHRPDTVSEAVEAGPVSEAEQLSAAAQATAAEDVAIPDGSEEEAIAAEVEVPAEQPATVEDKDNTDLNEMPVTEDERPLDDLDQAASAAIDIVSAVSDLSPPPTTSQNIPIPPVNVEEATPIIPQSPVPEETSSRTSKRKAADQLTKPTSKRSGRHAASPAQSPVGVPSEEPEETKAEEEENRAAKDRRSSRRTNKRGAPSPQASSPTPSRRGASVVSASSTPAADEPKSTRRGVTAKGMRGEVMSKSIRAQSVAESMKEVEDDAERQGEDEEAPRSAGRTKRGKPETAHAESKRSDSKEGLTGKRSKRGSFRGQSLCRKWKLSGC